MNERQKRALRIQLEEDEQKRDRGRFDYTVDALREKGIFPLSIWPESNQDVAGVIRGEVNYESLPIDEANEFHKAMGYLEQQDIILRNREENPLCEALDMTPCLKKECVLYESSLGPPVCREFKIAFEK